VLVVVQAPFITVGLLEVAEVLPVELVALCADVEVSDAASDEAVLFFYSQKRGLDIAYTGCLEFRRLKRAFLSLLEDLNRQLFHCRRYLARKEMKKDLLRQS